MIFDFLRHKHVWILMGLKATPRDKDEVARQRATAPKGTLVFTYKIDWQYEQCRKCGKVVKPRYKK